MPSICLHHHYFNDDQCIFIRSERLPTREKKSILCERLVLDTPTFATFFLLLSQNLLLQHYDLISRGLLFTMLMFLRHFVFRFNFHYYRVVINTLSLDSFINQNSTKKKRKSEAYKKFVTFNCLNTFIACSTQVKENNFYFLAYHLINA